jgi:hypothetical protein
MGWRLGGLNSFRVQASGQQSYSGAGAEGWVGEIQVQTRTRLIIFVLGLGVRGESSRSGGPTSRTSLVLIQEC